MRTLASSTFDSSTGTLTLNFTASGAVTTMEAGKPYLIKWSNTGVNLMEADLVFSGVTIRSSTNDVTCDLGDDGSVIFKGTNAKKEYTATDHTILLLGTDNKLYYPQSGASIGAQRAYFQLNGLTAGDQANNARAFVLNFGDDDSTLGVTTPLSDGRGAGGEAWYSVSGQRLNAKPTQRGIYINNGKKIIIK